MPRRSSISCELDFDNWRRVREASGTVTPTAGVDEPTDEVRIERFADIEDEKRRRHVEGDGELRRHPMERPRPSAMLTSPCSHVRAAVEFGQRR